MWRFRGICDDDVVNLAPVGALPPIAMPAD